MVIRPGVVAPVLETATAYFCGWPAGPTGLIAVMTGRYWLPQPSRAARVRPAAALRREPDRLERPAWPAVVLGVAVAGEDAIGPAALLAGVRTDVLSAGCKTAPTEMLVLGFLLLTRFGMLKARL